MIHWSAKNDVVEIVHNRSLGSNVQIHYRYIKAGAVRKLFKISAIALVLPEPEK